ncbi:MAG: histidinol-phosphate transaminase [Deltaproteobacteria bacterium]|nr:histidinol-phosphate transaminase [Deltaproteobacteria bacterium]
MFEYLVTKEIESLKPYPPGKPIEEVERELGITNVIKMASNENFLGPSPKATAAVTRAIPDLHRYPDASGFLLKQALSEYLELDAGHIALGNGSDEIIELIVRCFLRPGQKVITSDPTFLFYSIVVRGANGRLVTIPLKNFKHDLAGVSKAIDADTRLIFLDTPNNPSGSIIPAHDLKSFIDDLPQTMVLVLDEAYRDFVRGEKVLDPRDYLQGDRPIIFLRTFSKAYGLAGLRIGYGLAHSELISYFDRVRQPFDITPPAQAGAMAALDDTEFYKKTLDMTWSGLDFLWDELDKLNIQYHRSQTNYFLVELDRPAEEVTNMLMREGIIVRSMASYGMSNTIRITVGLPEENQRLINALKKVLSI